MRWQLVLQTAVGFGVLFWLGRDAAERYVGPLAEVQAERTAQAEARAVVSQVARAWERVRDAHRSLLSMQATGPVRKLLRADADASKDRSSTLASLLASALAQSGMEGAAAAFVTPDGTALAMQGPGSTHLASVAGTKEAIAGSSAIRFDRLEDRLCIIGSAPVEGEKNGDPPAGAMVLALPLDDARLRGWVTSDPEMAGSHVALFQGGRLAASTLPSADQKALQNLASEVLLTLQGRTFAVARNTITDDVGFGLAVAGFVPVDRTFVAGVVNGAQALISILGGCAFLVVLIIIAAAPRPAPEVVEIPAELPPVDETLQSSPGRSVASGARARASVIETLPRGAARPVVALSDVVEDNVDDDALSLEPTPLPLPLDALSEASPFDEGTPVRDSWIGDSVSLRPGMTGASASASASVSASASAPAAASDLFSAIDRAASSAAPHPVGANAMPRFPSNMSQMGGVDPAEDLPAPKGGMPLGVSPAMAAHTPSTDLPMPKGGSFPGSGSTMPVAQPTVSNPNRPVLPPLSQTPPLPDRSEGARPVEEDSEAVPTQGAAEPLPPAPAFPAPPAFPTLGASSDAARRNVARNASSDLESMRAPPALGGTGSDDAVALPGRATHGAEDGVVALPGAAVVSAPTGRASHQTGPATSPPRAPDGPVAFDETHYRVVYNEFVASKARLGDAIDDVTFEGFSAKLRSSERDLISRHGCRAVRFQVLVKDRTVSLRPQLVR